MSFAQSFPTVARLIGDKSVDLLEQHAAYLTGKPHDVAITHFTACELADWCALNTTTEFRDRLEVVERGLQQVEAAVGAEKLQSAFSNKSRNRDQFNQLLAEIATATTCASRSKLLELEWRTGEKNFDADVRAEFSGEPANLEVTLRTDAWLKESTLHLEDVVDEQGNQIGPTPAAKSRRRMTDREREDLRESGVVLPARVSDVIAERKKAPPTMEFVSDPNNLPPETQPKAYGADGYDPNVESNNVQSCIQAKVSKFNADGNHFVVLATMNPSFPGDRSVFDALFGQAPQIKHHGLFEDGLHNQICGVLYIAVVQQLQRLSGREDIEPMAKLFLNHNAKVKPSDSLLDELAKVFEAEITRGWVDT